MKFVRVASVLLALLGVMVSTGCQADGSAPASSASTGSSGGY